MGWGGAGLGSKEQGIDTPISGGDVSKKMTEKCSVVNIILGIFFIVIDQSVLNIVLLYKIIFINGFVLVVIIN